MREMLFKEAEWGLVGRDLGEVFGVDLLVGMCGDGAGVGGSRRNGGRVWGIVARARGDRDA